MKNNRLIAEFLGLKSDEDGYYKNGYHLDSTLMRMLDYSRHESDLHFDSDWNWLMQVVLKINTLGDYDYNVRIQTMDCYIEDNNGVKIVDVNCQYNPDELIKSVYEAVVEFIKWYNGQNK